MICKTKPAIVNLPYSIETADAAIFIVQIVMQEHRILVAIAGRSLRLMQEYTNSCPYCNQSYMYCALCKNMRAL